MLFKGEELDPATQRIIDRMNNAKPIGAPDDPRMLSHSKLAEERLDEKRERLSPAAKRLVASMENAKAIGLPSDPQEISHSKLAEEHMEEKFPWLGNI